MTRGYFYRPVVEKYDIQPYQKFERIDDGCIWKVINVTKFYVTLSTGLYTRYARPKVFFEQYKKCDQSLKVGD